MKEAIIFSFKERSNIEFIKNFSQFIQKNQRNDLQGSINLDRNDLLGQSNIDELYRCLKSEKIGDFILAVDFITASFMGKIDEDRRNFLQIYEIITKFNDEEYDISIDKFNANLQLFGALLNSRFIPDYHLDYVDKIGMFINRFAKQHKVFLDDCVVIDTSFSSKKIDFKDLNSLLLISHGISGDRLQTLISTRNLYSDYISMHGKEDENFHQRIQKVITFTKAISSRPKFRYIYRKIIKAFNATDRNNIDIFESLLSTLVQINIEIADDNSRDNIKDILLQYDDQESKKTVLNKVLLINVKLEDFANVKNTFLHIDYEISDTILNAILDTDFSEALELVYRKNPLVNKVEGKSLLHWALLNDKINIADLSLRKSLESGIKLADIFTDNEVILGNLITTVDGAESLIDSMFKFGCKAKDINDIVDRGLAVISAENDNFKIIENY